MDSELQDAIERIDAAQLGGESLDDEPEYRAVELVTNTARKYANLPDFPGFDRWHDALVVRGVDYIDEYRDEDDGLIDWITAVLALGVTEKK